LLSRIQTLENEVDRKVQDLEDKVEGLEEKIADSQTVRGDSPPLPPLIPPAPSSPPPQVPEVGPRPPKGYLEGIAGVTFQTESGGFVAGAVLVSVSPIFQVFGEIGYLSNVLPKSDQEEFDAIASEVSGLVIDSQAPFFYGMGGVRALVPTDGKVRPYLDFGFGISRGKEERSIVLEGEDVTADFRVAGDEFVRTPTTTGLLWGLGGGINVLLSNQLVLDIGYRYMRISVEEGTFFEEDVVRASRAYAALGYGF
jgi:hypothetical protein